MSIDAISSDGSAESPGGSADSEGDDMALQSRPTLADVAKLAEVSPKTVSRVYSDPDAVSVETKRRVLQAAERLLYKPNTLARDLRLGGAPKIIAFITVELTNPFYIQVAAGVERECADNGYTMILATSDDPERERVVIDSLVAGRVRGLLLVPLGSDYSYLDGERRLGTSVVAIDRPLRNMLADSVVLANREGGHLATRRLIEAGHRRIGYVCNPASVYTQSERLAGHRQALREAGLPDDGRWEALADDPTTTMEDLTVRLLESADPPTALVGGNNRATTGILRVLVQRGLDLGLVGFDDFDIADFHQVSVVAHDPRELGRSAARLALRRMDNPTGHTVHLELPVHYVARGSGERPPAD
jgi:LacI family transcriptional regulator